jgi:hypothetical protein
MVLSKFKNAVPSFKGKAYHVPSFGNGESKVNSVGGYDSEHEELRRWLHAYEESEKSFHSFSLFCEHKLQQTAVLTDGWKTPNALRTAVVMDCVRKLKRVFPAHAKLMVSECYMLNREFFLPRKRDAHSSKVGHFPFHIFSRLIFHILTLSGSSMFLKRRLDKPFTKTTESSERSSV